MGDEDRSLLGEGGAGGVRHGGDLRPEPAGSSRLQWRGERVGSALVCRNITELRGLQPPATAEEIEAAALQYVRKVSGLRQPPRDELAAIAFDNAVREVASITTRLLGAMPQRVRPPANLPPLRRPEVRARIEAQAAKRAAKAGA